jgi:glycosyltransferase involved in cell wall biosynthesis
MKIALFESIMTPGGHEIEFDRMLVEELTAFGHEVYFEVPEKHKFQFDYKVPVHTLPGEGVSYTGLGKLAKIWYAAKREINRLRWFNALETRAADGAFDMVIIPTASYRFLRTATRSRIRHSAVPVVFIVHGVMARDEAVFFAQADKLAAYPNIKIAVLTPEDKVFERTRPNVYCIKPPTYTPRDIPDWDKTTRDDRLRLGFFGQYRREKNLDAFLAKFVDANFPEWVELFVQGATVDPVDTADFQRIQKKYGGNSQIDFLHKGLVGRAWQEAILGVDALIMPYAAERFRYQPSAMLYTAIGYGKPVVVADNMHPQLFDQYKIGVQFAAGDDASLQQALRTFVDTYKEMKPVYERELARINADFGASRMAAGLAALGENK